MEWKEALEKNANPAQLVKAIRRGKCSSLLGKGMSSTLGVYKVCEDRGCTSCAALKIASPAQPESNISVAIERVAQASPFREHVLRLIFYRPLAQSESSTLITQLLPSRKTLDDVKSSMSLMAVKVFLVQVLETLAFLRRNVPGFAHMDLGHNIVMTSWKATQVSKDVERLTETLPCSFGGEWSLPPQRYWPILMDFGNSRTNQYTNPSLWGPSGDSYGCGKPSFDIYKLLTKLLRVQPVFIGKLMQWSFGDTRPVPFELPYWDSKYQLPLKEGCKLLGSVDYEDVLQHPEFRVLLA